MRIVAYMFYFLGLGYVGQTNEDKGNICAQATFHTHLHSGLRACQTWTTPPGMRAGDFALHVRYNRRINALCQRGWV